MSGGYCLTLTTSFKGLTFWTGFDETDFRQSARNWSSPLSVSGCLISCCHHFEWHRGHICASARRFNHVNGMANAGREHLGLPIVIVIDFHDVTDEFQTVLPDVIESPDERADVGGARFRGQDCLRR